jgi:serine/threonine protein kinase
LQKPFDADTLYDTILNNRKCELNFYIAELRFVSSKGKTLLFELPGLDLLKRMLDCNPSSRITAEKALEHEYIKSLE